MTTLLLFLSLVAPDTAQQAHPSTCPMHAAHTKAPASTATDHSHARAEMDALGSHHFTVLANGGVIEITAGATEGEAARSRIAAHLSDISTRFKAGDFAIPEATHGVMPPGAKEMAAARDRIEYRFEPIPDGGRVHITTTDRAALAAVHTFLRYQIQEHRAPAQRP